MKQQEELGNKHGKKVMTKDIMMHYTSKYIVFLSFLLSSCGPLQDINDIAQTTRDVAPLIQAGKDIADDMKNSEGPRDWAGIAEKIAYGVAGVSALIAGNEVRRRRKKAKA